VAAYFRNRSSHDVTVYEFENGGTTYDIPDVVVPAGEVRTIYTAHGDSATAGRWVSHPVCVTSDGDVVGPDYTFVVE
jgi:hypothetical protein